MNKREREVMQVQLDSEKAVLAELKRQYQSALDQINEKILMLQADELTQSKVYQLQYQQALKGQVEGIIEKLHGDEYTTIQQYLSDSYTTGFVGTMYDMAGQGIPMILPIDQKAAVKAILTDSKINDGLYNSLGVDAKILRKSIRQEITRGIASGLTYNAIARNIQARTKAPLSNARRIVQTEGHRIQQSATFDAQQASKAKGADVVKQWDATLDGATRPTHRKLDTQIREVDEPFEADGKEAMFPGDFGDPAEDCNCRCVSLTRARWALDEDELQTMKDRAAFFGLDKTKDFEDFKNKYINASKTLENTRESDKIDTGAKGALTSKNDPEFKKRKAHAEQYYESIRNSDMQSIVNVISQNTGMASGKVEKAISHLFYEKHDLEKGHTFFEEDYDIAESIRRLREGRNIQPHDLILLQHEAKEADYMASGMPFEEAHEKTEESYNYTLALRVFLKANELE